MVCGWPNNPRIGGSLAYRYCCYTDILRRLLYLSIRLLFQCYVMYYYMVWRLGYRILFQIILYHTYSTNTILYLLVLKST